MGNLGIYERINFGMNNEESRTELEPKGNKVFLEVCHNKTKVVCTTFSCVFYSKDKLEGFEADGDTSGCF